MRDFEPYNNKKSFDYYFNKITEILTDTQSVNIKAKRIRGFSHFTYSRRTWITINAINKIKRLLPEEYCSSRGGRSQIRRMKQKLNKAKTEDELEYGNNLSQSINKRRHRIWNILNPLIHAEQCHCHRGFLLP
jgi:hypothetical protein